MGKEDEVRQRDPLTVVCISDTHGYHDGLKLPAGDVLIHAGDCTNDIGQYALRIFLRWLEEQPFEHKVMVAGNHDGAFEKWPDPATAMVKEVAPSVAYLQDSGVNIKGFNFWGSPYTPTFMDWYLMRDRGGEIKRHWDMIPDGTDVLVTHGPPHGICDLSNNINFATGKPFDDHLGCEELRKAVERVNPILHVFGHIHGSGGKWRQVLDAREIRTTFINASIMDEAYIPSHKPFVYELK
jgi:Icc-related predicted phosphoesterase